MSRARWQGVNLAGWLSQSSLSPAHIASFVSEADIQRIATWQFNHVRVPVATHFLWDAERAALREPGVAAVDRLVDWCERAGLQCFIALHLGGAPDPAGQLSTLHQEDDRQRLIALWGAVAARYASQPESHVAYDLVHRPSGITAAAWNRTARAITEAIRAVDTRHTLVVSGADGGCPAGFDTLRPTRDPNTLYACHFYEPDTFYPPTGSDYSASGDAYREAVHYPRQRPAAGGVPGRRHWRVSARRGGPALGPRRAGGSARSGPGISGDLRPADLRCVLWRLVSSVAAQPTDVAALRIDTLQGPRHQLVILDLQRARDSASWTPGDDLAATTADDPTAGLDYDRLALLQSV